MIYEIGRRSNLKIAFLAIFILLHSSFILSLSALTNSTAAPSWRLIYDSGTVISLEQSAGVTTTKFMLFEAATKAECDAQIAALGLTPLPADPVLADPPSTIFSNGVETTSLTLNPIFNGHGYDLVVDPTYGRVLPLERNSVRKTNAALSNDLATTISRLDRVFQRATNFWLNLNPPWSNILVQADLTNEQNAVQWENFCNTQINTNQQQATAAGTNTVQAITKLNKALNWLQNYNKGNTFLGRLGN